MNKVTPPTMTTVPQVSPDYVKVTVPAASAVPIANDSARADLIGGFEQWDLWGRLAWLEIKRRYHRTVIGPFWTALSLAIFISALGTVGAGLWHQDIASYLPFLIGGMVVWTMLSTIMIEACSVFVTGAGLFRQMRFKYSILAYAVIWRNFIVFLHNLSVYVLVNLIFAPKQLIDPHLVLAIPGLVLVLINGVWMVVIIGMLCLRFRDIQQVVTSLVQISMFVTPIFWPPDNLPGVARFVFVTFNPLYHLIEIVRAPLLGKTPTLNNYIAVLIITAVGWTLTYVVFSNFRKRIPYWS